MLSANSFMDTGQSQAQGESTAPSTPTSGTQACSHSSSKVRMCLLHLHLYSAKALYVQMCLLHLHLSTLLKHCICRNAIAFVCV